jgi:hypothetical protein
MVAGIFLVTRTTQGVNDDRNRVREVVVHEDDAQTAAQIIAAVIATLNTAQPVEVGAEDIYPAGYFDTVVQIGASPVADLDTDGDLIAYAPRVVAVDAP